MSDSLRSPGLYLCLWNAPGKNTGVDWHSLLHGIFPTQDLNPGLLYHRQILYCLSHQGSTNLEACLSGHGSFRWAEFTLSPKCHCSRGSQRNSIRLIRCSRNRIRKYRRFCKYRHPYVHNILSLLFHAWVHIYIHICVAVVWGINKSKVNSRTRDLRVVIKYKWWSNPIRVCISPGWCGDVSSGSMRQTLAHASALPFLSPSCLLKSVSHTCPVPSPLHQGCCWLAMIEKFWLPFIALPISAVNQTLENIHVILRKVQREIKSLEEPQRSVEGKSQEFPWSQGLRDSDLRTKTDPRYVRKKFREKGLEKGSLSGKNKLVFPEQSCTLYK